MDNISVETHNGKNVIVVKDSANKVLGYFSASLNVDDINQFSSITLRCLEIEPTAETYSNNLHVFLSKGAPDFNKNFVTGTPTEMHGIATQIMPNTLLGDRQSFFNSLTNKNRYSFYDNFNSSTVIEELVGNNVKNTPVHWVCDDNTKLTNSILAFISYGDEAARKSGPETRSRKLHFIAYDATKAIPTTTGTPRFTSSQHDLPISFGRPQFIMDLRNERVISYWLDNKFENIIGKVYNRSGIVGTLSLDPLMKDSDTIYGIKISKWLTNSSPLLLLNDYLTLDSTTTPVSLHAATVRGQYVGKRKLGTSVLSGDSTNSGIFDSTGTNVGKLSFAAVDNAVCDQIGTKMLISADSDDTLTSIIEGSTDDEKYKNQRLRCIKLFEGSPSLFSSEDKNKVFVMGGLLYQNDLYFVDGSGTKVSDVTITPINPITDGNKKYSHCFIFTVLSALPAGNTGKRFLVIPYSSIVDKSTITGSTITSGINYDAFGPGISKKTPKPAGWFYNDGSSGVLDDRSGTDYYVEITPTVYNPNPAPATVDTGI